MTRARLFALALCVLVVVAGVAVVVASGRRPSGPIKIGVMLPLTGPDAVGFQRPLQWASQNVNAAGGVDGRPIKFVYRDINHLNPLAVARRFASDSSIAAVIGPDNSEVALQAASIFMTHHKVMVTPSATSANLFRAFASDRPQYVWRPLESDLAQVRAMLQLARQDGARSVALVAGNSTYGVTFFDAFGFQATNDGLRVTATIRYPQERQGCAGPIDQALRSGAQVVLAVPDHARQAICMARAWRAQPSHARLLFADSAEKDSVISALGPRAAGLQGIGLAPGAGSGFARAYQARFGRPPVTYAANTYDSVLMLAYGLERSHGADGAALAKSIMTVVDGRGQTVSWNRSAVATTLHAIRAGRLPSIHGAVGRWDFDKTDGIELVASTYEHWQVRGGRFAVVNDISTATSSTARQGVSEAEAEAPVGANSVLGAGARYRTGPKTGTWALLVAASDGWENYRHQADVFAQYQRLRSGGVPASHIIVVSADDMADNRSNPDQGSVPYTAGGPNVATGAHIDYRLHGMTAERLMDILSGHVTPSTPKVIHSGPGTDVYVYIAGHGNSLGVYLGLGEPVPVGHSYSIITPALLDGTISEMAAQHRYRRILVAVEACQSGTLGRYLNAPGALMLTAANPVEDSLSGNYDPALKTWLNDQFSYQLWKAEGATPDTSLDSLYQHLYLTVPGSHVSAYGTRFGDAATVSLHEFFSP